MFRAVEGWVNGYAHNKAYLALVWDDWGHCRHRWSNPPPSKASVALDHSVGRVFCDTWCGTLQRTQHTHLSHHMPHKLEKPRLALRGVLRSPAPPVSIWNMEDDNTTAAVSAALRLQYIVHTAVLTSSIVVAPLPPPSKYIHEHLWYEYCSTNNYSGTGRITLLVNFFVPQHSQPQAAAVLLCCIGVIL